MDKVRGREPHYWMEGDDSVKQMEAVERIYEKVRSCIPFAQGLAR